MTLVVVAVSRRADADQAGGRGGEARPLAADQPIALHVLLGEYKANPVAADKKFKDKLVVVNDVTIEKIGQAPDGTAFVVSERVLGLYVDDRWEYGRAVWGDVKPTDPMTDKLRRGSHQTIEAKCLGRVVGAPSGLDMPEANWYVLFTQPKFRD